MIIKKSKLKQLLIDAEILTEEQFSQAEEKARHQKQEIDNVVVGEDYISDVNLGRLIASELGLDFVNLRQEAIDKRVLKIIPEVVALNKKIIAFGQDKGVLRLAMADPYDLNIVKMIEKSTGNKVEPYYATARDIFAATKNYREKIEKVFSEIIEENLGKIKKTGVSPEKAALELPVVKIVDTIIEYAYDNRASDIHIEPYEKSEVIRFRIDGILHDVFELPKSVHEMLIARIKIMSKLRTDEHRAAQDGRIEVKTKEEKIDIRVSIVPILRGEKVVMRLLAEKTRRLGIEELGFLEADLEKVKVAATRPYGMILATGPTGCGKTTTLYSVLKTLNKREVNIATIEDPVEYDVEGVNQIQVNQKTELTFAKGLRSILRQDPDIIMVGEIRDQETASIAVNSAMTGHLVLSTLHTNDAATALPRFLEMGVEPFLIASTVNVVIGQRLVRKLCLRCVESYILKGEKLEELRREIDMERILKKDKAPQLRLFRGKGCKHCKHSGYLGRVGIYEVLEMNEKIKSMIMARTNSDDIKAQAMEDGMTTMVYDGLKKAMTGITTIDEVLRVSRM
ncbi:GspE/PulE family protein [Patescibacteria group bacterium]|nr:GspE/PulE family protein [Patescibacteria group bacterium]MBU1922367.1 GspE/PulE family protein [Patescibacteria group bacterium]